MLRSLKCEKARYDPDTVVRAKVIESLLGYNGASSYLVQDGLMEFLDYDNPRFNPDACLVLFSMETEGSPRRRGLCVCLA